MTAKVFAAFVKAQAEIEKASKDKTNPHFRSKYADLGNVVDAIKPALEKHGLAFLQKFHENPDGIAVETIIIHESGESFSNGVLSVPATKRDAQGYGSACTYARRYSLQAAFGVAPEDDDGNAASQPQRQQQAQAPAKPQLAPNTKFWTNAKAAYLRDGNLDKVKAHMTITPEHEKQLIAEAEHDRQPAAEVA